MTLLSKLLGFHVYSFGWYLDLACDESCGIIILSDYVSIEW
jgi:hypothetical protein